MSLWQLVRSVCQPSTEWLAVHCRIETGNCTSGAAATSSIMTEENTPGLHFSASFTLHTQTAVTMYRELHFLEQFLTRRSRLFHKFPRSVSLKLHLLNVPLYFLLEDHPSKSFYLTFLTLITFLFFSVLQSKTILSLLQWKVSLPASRV